MPTEMNNQAAQTMPPVPQAFFDEFGVNADDRVMDYGRACYAAALSQPAGVPEGWTRDVADAAASLDKRGDRQMAARLMRLHRDMLAAAPATSGGDDGVDADDDADYLDAVADVLESIGKGIMARAVQVIAAHMRELASHPPAGASVSERATVSLDLNNLPAEWPWDEGSPCLAPRPVGMVYPGVPTPRAFGYLDKTGVEWAAYDTGQMEEYGRRAFADGANTALRAIEHALSSPRQEGEECAVSGTLESLVAQIVASFPMVAIVRAFDKAAQGMGAALTSPTTGADGVSP